MLLGSVANDQKLEIDQVIGTSAKTASNFVVQDNLVAYLASGGVVVSTIDSKTKSITSQRFFCANRSSFTGQIDDLSPSPANAYLNMALGESNVTLEPEKKDSFGFPISLEIEIVYGSNFKSSLETNENTSPSKLKDRVRSINCLALSPNKKVLALGEIGYAPRILLFSLAPDLSSNPVASIHEHSFGINAIAFSPDLKHLCSLGTTNDGYINIWKFSTSAISLHATNKCSSVINQLIWHENLIITLGLRIIKVWLFEQNEESPIKVKTAALKGKNVLLGSLINSNFVGGCALSNDEFLIFTKSQQLLLLKLDFGALKLVHLESPIFDYSNILVDYELGKIWLSSETSTVNSIDISDLKPTSDTPSTPHQLSRCNTSQLDDGGIIKWANLSEQYLIYLTSREKIVLFDKALNHKHTLVESVLNNISGVRTTYCKKKIVFSHNGNIKEITESEGNISIDHVIKIDLIGNETIQNGLTAVDSKDLSKSLIVGDSYGQIYVIKRNVNDERPYETIYRTKAHSSSVTEIVYFEINDYEFFSSISRDRMIQLFYRKKSDEVSKWDILQTLPTHTGNLLKLHYHDSRVFVCSTDRTLSIHKIVVTDDQVQVLQEKIITLKNTPMSMKFFADELIVSTSDKSLLIYQNHDKFEFKRALKLHDEKINEYLLIEDFVVHDKTLIISCSDKSIRTFSYASAKPLSVCWGHLDSILSLFMNDDKNLLYSIGSDGCLFKWNLVALDHQSPSETRVDLLDDQETLPLYTKVTRKIITTTPAPSPRRKKSVIQDEVPASPVDSDRSPSPRLSNATMKRMEARKKLEPVPSMVPTAKIAPEYSRPIVPSAVRQTSPTRSPTRVLRPVSPSRVITKRAQTFPEGAAMRAQDDFMEKSIAYLTIIKSKLPKATITTQERQKLRAEVEELANLLNEDCDSINLGLINNDFLQQFSKMSMKDNEFMLQRYSDKLVEMVGHKLDALVNK